MGLGRGRILEWIVEVIVGDYSGILFDCDLGSQGLSSHRPKYFLSKSLISDFGIRKHFILSTVLDVAVFNKFCI